VRFRNKGRDHYLGLSEQPVARAEIPENVFQGLRPIVIKAFIATTEVAP
jgi:hypothetical protein